MTTKKTFIISAVSISVCVLSLVVFRIYKKNPVVEPSLLQPLPSALTEAVVVPNESSPKEEKSTVVDNIKKSVPAAVSGLQYPVTDSQKVILVPEVKSTQAPPQVISPKLIAEHEAKMRKFSALPDKERLEKTKENLSYIRNHATKDRLLMINPALLRGDISVLSNVVYQVQLENLRADLEEIKQQKKH